MTPHAHLCALALGLTFAFSSSALAQSDPAAEARAAAEQLEEATRALDAATSARDRVRALSQTVRAYEAGLRAMREGQRRAAIREQALERDLAASEREIAQLLGVLQSMGSTPAPVTLLHPSGPVGTARSGMILADVTPGLAQQATALRAKLEDLAMLRTLQQSAASRLDEGLAGVQTARTALSQAIADRTDLPRRFTEDAVRTALLIASTESLDGFASGLSQIAVDEAPGSLPGIEDRKGLLPLPLEGRIIRRAGEADAAGITRPGIVMAAPPRALVTSPWQATIRYTGPLLDYKNVMVLEPSRGFLLVLAGLDIVYGSAGDVLGPGTPVGLMGGTDDAAQDLTAPLAQSGGQRQTETLYMELRQGDVPVDPATWFALGRE